MLDQLRSTALQHGHNYVGTEHVLLLLVAEETAAGSGPLLAAGVTLEAVEAELKQQLAKVPTKAAALKSVGVDPAAVQASTGTTVRTAGAVAEGWDGWPPLTRRLGGILDAAGSLEAGPVLRAVLEEDSNLAVVVLERLGVDLEALRSSL